MKKGFTLIELMIAVAIIVVLVPVFVFPLLNNMIYSYWVNLGYSNMARSNYTLAHALENDVYSAEQSVKEWKTYRSGDACLILKLPSPQPDKLTAEGSDYIIYFKDNDALVKQVYPGSKSQRMPGRNIIARNLKDIKFSQLRFNNKLLVTCEATYSFIYRKKEFTKTLIMSFGPRNGSL